MLLTLGVLFWAVTHLFVSIGAGARTRLTARIGLGPYKGLFSLTLVGALVLIVVGWRTMAPTALYLAPVELRYATMFLVPIAVILFISARAPTDVKQIIRHPQLAGVKLWAIAHLLSNGEIRSLVLFGGLLAWAVLEVIFINRRDGAWSKPVRVGTAKTLVTVAIGLVISVVLMFAHPWFAGRPVMM
jgi:uncharacterized membrane protein